MQSTVHEKARLSQGHRRNPDWFLRYGRRDFMNFPPSVTKIAAGSCCCWVRGLLLIYSWDEKRGSGRALASGQRITRITLKKSSSVPFLTGRSALSLQFQTCSATLWEDCHHRKDQIARCLLQYRRSLSNFHPAEIMLSTPSLLG